MSQKPSDILIQGLVSAARSAWKTDSALVKEICQKFGLETLIFPPSYMSLNDLKRQMVLAMDKYLEINPASIEGTRKDTGQYTTIDFKTGQDIFSSELAISNLKGLVTETRNLPALLKCREAISDVEKFLQERGMSAEYPHINIYGYRSLFNWFVVPTQQDFEDFGQNLNPNWVVDWSSKKPGQTPTPQ